MRTSARRSLLVGVLFVLSLLAGCATMESGTPAANPQATAAEELFQRGEFRAAADAFLALAKSSSATRGHYRLRAAEALREEGDLGGAAANLEDVKRKRLTPDDAFRYDLLQAELALEQRQPEQALALLAMPDSSLSPALALRRIELTARAQEATGDRYGAARTRAVLDRSLSGADREHNRQQIVDTLAALETAVLKQRGNELPADDALRPWIERALRKQGQMLPLTVLKPSRPVGTLSAEGTTREGYSASRHVALLLPATGALKGAAAAIRDGFFAAWFNDRAPGAERGEVRVYDSGLSAQDAYDAYHKAVQAGADRVVGPLSREAVGALFEQGRLPVPVLALNQADSGATPPPGSIAFGLVPDGEGAQVAERMAAMGIKEAAVIAATDDWAERAALAFRAQFESLGGAVVGESRLREGEINYSALIQQSVGAFATASNAGVFISMRPQQARLLMPQLRLAGVTLPVLATSHVYAGTPNPGLDRDLDGLEFCDSPWLLDAAAGLPPRDEIARGIDSARGTGARLFALGYDAYALLPYMSWLGTHPDSYLPGATGQLAADSFGRVHRLMTWARFENGVARAAGLSVGGAL
ncbi:penicillin-binding protein activator [Tahibacter amnicola]|uniref:Penicillin-binding protein activator n=1 Tax=Tahibacter amnicola TaxID=2976241 RepID=A0ABY6BGL9_9GAMM|nr:penicillin-binding protein activator [Tahibacter amnicola]UXI67751.1 penicillin-binding protein activator [Tahibacter amnicola]